VTAESDFVAYAEARVLRLRQRAYLLCHDWHLAQDLTQITLARLYASWRKITKTGNVDAYAAKVMVRAFLDHKRRKSSGEVVTDSIPERADTRSPDLRLTLLEALRGLPPRERAIVVLRYWEDHSVDVVAEMLGTSPGVVKTQSMRALAQLRTSLGSDLATLVD
jgi:RNA polymerase sigma-70 factor (sigma-E family)